MKPYFCDPRLFLSAGLVLSLVVAAGVPARGDGQETELKDDAGNTIVHYVVDAPPGIAPAGTTDPAKQVGLILCFQEHGHPTGDELPTVRESLVRQKIRDNYVLLAAHAQDPLGKFRDVDHEPLEKLIAWAEKTYPVNPRRIYMFGRGEGAKITGEFGSTHPNLITAGITYSWGFWKMPAEVTDPLAPQFYMNLGLKDLGTHITTVRDTYSRVKAKGYHVIYREFANFGANTVFPLSNDDALAWETRLRNRTLPLSPQEAALLNAYSSPKYKLTGPDPFGPLVLVGGAQAGTVLQHFLAAKDAGVRLAAVEACRRALFGEATEVALAKRLADPDSKVRAAAVQVLAMAANWRSEVAQRALVQLAEGTPGKKAALADRLAAVDAVGQAVELQKKGVCQDPPLFQALVTLLDDPDEQVRTHAFAVLSPIRESDYKPGAAPAERETAVAGWKQWAQEITAKEDAYGKAKPAAVSTLR